MSCVMTLTTPCLFWIIYHPVTGTCCGPSAYVDVLCLDHVYWFQKYTKVPILMCMCGTTQIIVRGSKIPIYLNIWNPDPYWYLHIHCAHLTSVCLTSVFCVHRA